MAGVNSQLYVFKWNNCIENLVFRIKVEDPAIFEHYVSNHVPLCHIHRMKMLPEVPNVLLMGARRLLGIVDILAV